jgi:hypothetical protein
MIEFPLNKIVHSQSGFTCLVFVLNVINVGGLVIDELQFKNINILKFNNCTFRYYRKSKKIVISSSCPTEFEYAAINLNYSMWQCLLCKKISPKTESKCFCESYSICWTPINGEISGVEFNNDGNFCYHFNDNSLSNLII